MRVAIIGLGPGWEEAPYDCETWGINQLICRRPVSKVIDIHIMSQCDNEQEQQYLIDARKRAKEDNTPIIEIENYPLHEIIEEFGSDYFANSVAYAIALAIYKGYDEIDLYGVNQSTGKEYIFEKGGVEYWIGFAKGRGIKVTVNGDESILLLTNDKRMYGFNLPQGAKR